MVTRLLVKYKLSPLLSYVHSKVFLAMSDNSKLEGKLLFNTGGLKLPSVKFEVIIIQTEFDDATLIKATGKDGECSFYLMAIPIIAV